MSDPVFRLSEGKVTLGGRPVLRGVDLVVGPGEVVAVLGPNGSGKSTLVRTLLGLVPLASGSVEIYGRTPQRFRDWRRIGYVPQRLTAGGGVPATVREVVASGRIARQRRFLPASAADRAAVRDALAEVELADRAGDPVQHLSGGQQQRVLIARALAGQPDTYVMDEPTAGVDAASQQALAASMRRVAGEGKTVVLVAHELGPLAPVITRVVVLTDGEIVKDGPPSIADTSQEHCHPHESVWP
ncbi:metal ABC transporter ATP-binding protein [Rhizohabitans arisaemae]|uniref:metal ABC transporter ATP-binding protein n=1 Tax=Rhizohabitans arisaemae TaxID=2720610 RepID=UPI0024B09367|nr:metal ABC transporter ATP-binding protein [Rhizohabitans arisaemae]